MEKFKQALMLAMLLLAGGATAVSAQSRYNKEFVFAEGMRNLSIGVSPTIMDMHSGGKVQAPVVSLLGESCFWDMSLGGSLGWGLMLSHGRWGYSFAGEDGRGGNRVSMRVGVNTMQAGLSYHYTLRTRLEVYARAMFGAQVLGTRSSRAGATRSMNGSFTWSGVAGGRWFFSRSWGVFAECGYTTGYANAGLTLRW